MARNTCANIAHASDTACSIPASPRLRAWGGRGAVSQHRGVLPRERAHRDGVLGPCATRRFQPSRQPDVGGKRTFRVGRDPDQGNHRGARARRGGRPTDAVLADVAGKVRRPQRQKIRGNRPLPSVRKRGRHMGGEADTKRR